MGARDYVVAEAVGGVAVGKVAVGDPVGEVEFGGVVLEPGAVGDPFVREPFCVGAVCWSSGLSVSEP